MGSIEHEMGNCPISISLMNFPTEFEIWFPFSMKCNPNADEEREQNRDENEKVNRFAPYHLSVADVFLCFNEFSFWLWL